MSTPKLQAFYKSRKWETFIANLRAERTNADGFIICEKCGKPILKAYDCIGHHITELTDDNVDDVMISLNPENIQLLHFKCHNEVHERFGYNGRQTQNVFIVYGAPCAGKRTFVRENANNNDLIIDIEKIWAAIRADKCTGNEKPNSIKSSVFAVRDTLLDNVRVRRGKWNNAYIIGGYPLQGERERLQSMVGADKLIFIDTPKDICKARAQATDENKLQYIDEWFERYSPPVGD